MLPYLEKSLKYDLVTDLDTWKLFWIIHLAPKSITSILIREKQKSFDMSAQRSEGYMKTGADIGII